MFKVLNIDILKQNCNQNPGDNFCQCKKSLLIVGQNKLEHSFLAKIFRLVYIYSKARSKKQQLFSWAYWLTFGNPENN
jgi:hypothetical protein